MKFSAPLNELGTGRIFSPAHFSFYPGNCYPSRYPAGIHCRCRKNRKKNGQTKSDEQRRRFARFIYRRILDSVVNQNQLFDPFCTIGLMLLDIFYKSRILCREIRFMELTEPFERLVQISSVSFISQIIELLRNYNFVHIKRRKLFNNRNSYRFKNIYNIKKVELKFSNFPIFPSYHFVLRTFFPENFSIVRLVES